jgi:hypothetical protein
MFYPIVVLYNPGDHELNKTDSTLYQEALFYGTVVHEKIFK